MRDGMNGERYVRKDVSIFVQSVYCFGERILSNVGTVVVSV